MTSGIEKKEPTAAEVRIANQAARLIAEYIPVLDKLQLNVIRSCVVESLLRSRNSGDERP
jgi:hypothetical protein